MVPKDNRSWRPCGDFRQLNDITEADQYPVPHIQDFSAQLAGKRVFSKVDIIRGYHQIPVASEDVHKTAIITPFGLYEFLRTPFGHKNAAQAFQRLMDAVCRGLEFVFVYLDDILIASRDTAEHPPSDSLPMASRAWAGPQLGEVRIRAALDSVPGPSGYGGWNLPGPRQRGSCQGVSATGHGQGINGVQWHGEFLSPFSAGGSLYHGPVVRRRSRTSVQQGGEE